MSLPASESFLQSLRERHIVRWALGYLAGAWVVLQVVDILAELFSWSLALQRVGFYLLVGGFFVALVLAWFHGGPGRQRVRPMEIGLLFAVAGGTVLPIALLPRAGVTGPETTAERGVGAAPAPSDDTRPAVAILPFRSGGGAGEPSYFADGIHEEIISQLARIQGVKVISRSSVMRYTSLDRTTREIADELGVGAILDGSVRQVDENVRITVTMTDPWTDESLWSDTYERELSEIFAIQEDVARQVVRALSATLTPEEDRELERRPTENLSAYDYYLLSRDAYRRLEGRELPASVEFAHKAIEADSSFAKGWLSLGRASMVMALGHAGVGDSPADEMDVARMALQRALDLDPGLAEAGAAMALILTTWDYDTERALEEARRAVAVAPSDAIAHEILGLVLTTLGRDDEAIAVSRKAADLGPSTSIIASNLGWVYLNAERYDEAIEEAHRALELDPDFHDPLMLLGKAYIRTGRFEDAVDWYRQGMEIFDESAENMAGMVHALARAGRPDEARQLLGRLLARTEEAFVPPLHVGYAYLGLDENEEAIDWFERGVEQRGGWTVWLPRYPEARRLHGDPRFRALIRRMGLESMLEEAGANASG